MNLIVNCSTRIINAPTGFTPGKYIELTTTVEPVVSLQGFVMDMQFPIPPPSTMTRFFGPVEEDKLLQTADELRTFELTRTRQMIKSMVMGC